MQENVGTVKPYAGTFPMGTPHNRTMVDQEIHRVMFHFKEYGSSAGALKQFSEAVEGIVEEQRVIKPTCVQASIWLKDERAAMVASYKHVVLSRPVNPVPLLLCKIR